jgi:hypothetical protein
LSVVDNCYNTVSSMNTHHFIITQIFIIKYTYNLMISNYRNRVLRQTSGLDVTGGISWELTLCLLLAWTIVFLVLTKGIKSLGKVSCFNTIYFNEIGIHMKEYKIHERTNIFDTQIKYGLNMEGFRSLSWNFMIYACAKEPKFGFNKRKGIIKAMISIMHEYIIYLWNVAENCKSYFL